MAPNWPFVNLLEPLIHTFTPKPGTDTFPPPKQSFTREYRVGSNTQIGQELTLQTRSCLAPSVPFAPQDRQDLLVDPAAILGNPHLVVLGADPGGQIVVAAIPRQFVQLCGQLG